MGLTSGSFRWLPSPDGSQWCDGAGGIDAASLASHMTSLASAAPPPSSTALPERLLLTTYGVVDVAAAAAAVTAACADASASLAL